MPQSKHVVCISTTKPTNSVTPSGGGGSLTVMCPLTGSVHSSLRTSADLSGKAPMGMSSVALFPRNFSTNNTQLAIAYGSNSSKKSDTYAMLLSLRSASSPPILHWKCRLPEAQLTAGIVVSPCGHYTVGGGASGNCYVWSSLGGNLLKTFKAHYRACSSLAWSDCGRYLITGGADGMVHVFSLMDLVDLSSNNSKRSIAPVHTWSAHHLSVTCIIRLASGRVASASEDGQVVIMEIFSQVVVATIQLPHGIRCLAHYDSRLFAGSTQGDIYIIDLDAYAMHQTAKQGATTAKRRRHEGRDQVSEQKVFGTNGSENTSDFQAELKGHDHPVTSVAVVVEEMQERLISGDESGTLRIWDIEARTCLSIVQPWSHTSMNGATVTEKSAAASLQQQHPVTSILVLKPPADAPETSSMFGSGTTGNISSKNQSSIANLVAPLQKFQQDQEGTQWVSVPLIQPERTPETMEYWRAKTASLPRKRKTAKNGDSGAPVVKKDKTSVVAQELQQQRDEVNRLQLELEEQKAQVERWEKVNNKLMAKLKSKK
jgi:WD40 repeat protein